VAAAILLLCHYLALNDPFYCIHHSRDSQCFSMGRTTPKIAPSCGGSRSLSNIHGSSGPCKSALETASQSDLFSCICTAHPCDQHTHKPTEKQTTLCLISVVTGCIYAVHAMWPKNYSTVTRRRTQLNIFNINLIEIISIIF